jgi:ATP-dependent DNA helicase PIF1
MNFQIQIKIAGQLMTYKSIDSVNHQGYLVVIYPTEFLNSMELLRLPLHNLQLEIRSVIIMLRKINQPRFCNGTRLVVKKLMDNVIEATILERKYKDEVVLIPQIPLIPNDMPFDYKRLQFPLWLAFSMSINKSEEQSLNVCGINLENPRLLHDQFMSPVPELEYQ